MLNATHFRCMKNGDGIQLMLRKFYSLISFSENHFVPYEDESESNFPQEFLVKDRRWQYYAEMNILENLHQGNCQRIWKGNSFSWRREEWVCLRFTNAISICVVPSPNRLQASDAVHDSLL